MNFLWFSYGWFSYGFPMVFLWFSNEFAIACSLHGFRKEPISAQFSQSFGRPWTPLGTPFGRLRDRPGLTLGSLGTPLDPSDELLGPPWATFGTPLGPRPKNTQKRRLRLHPFRTPFFTKKPVVSNAKTNHVFDRFLKHFYLILGTCLDSKNTRNPVQNEKCVFLNMSVSPTRKLIFQGCKV